MKNKIIFIAVLVSFYFTNSYSQYTISDKLYLQPSGLGNSHIPFYTGDVYLTGYSGSGNGDFIFRTFDGSTYYNRFRITSDGNVGIGMTTVPNYYKLHVNGTVGVDRNGSSDYASIELKADIGAFIDFTKGTNDYDGRIIWNYANNGRFNIHGDIKFMNKIVEDVTIDGNLIAEEVKVQNVPASDYVFESDYNLRPIKEVEAFVKENKHLPDIPSAEEFKKNGVGLGEMDNMLLMKVEELTLYVIELKKENENQSKEIELLKTKLNTR